MSLIQIQLKPGRERNLCRGHPWVFSGAIAEVHGSPTSGETVAVHAADGRFLAWAAWSGSSQIRLRIWSRDPDTRIDDTFLAGRITAAIDLRRRRGLLSADCACRLVYSEGDGLPGLVVDYFSGYLVCQFLSAGAERWRETLVDALASALRPAGIFERSTAASRRKEDLPPRQGLLRGNSPPPELEYQRNSLRWLANLAHGQKTGAYLDQHDNHQRVAAVATGRVLDMFSHAGGFGLTALAAGATHALLVDSSPDALDLARANADLNGLADRCEFQRGDAFEWLRTLVVEGRRFDQVILDPPKFVHSAAQVRKGARAYQDINRLALQLVAPGGTLATFSCSGNVDSGLFRKIIASAAAEADRDSLLLATLGQPPDHPVPLAVPESEYLKGLLLQVR